MIDLLKDHLNEISDICRRSGVCRLEVFGSAARGDFIPESSDVDFIAEFGPTPQAGDLLSSYMRLATDLEKLLGTDVDIITARSIRNPYFKQAVDSSREFVYAA
jgi:predicted nucleotidyltransferase